MKLLEHTDKVGVIGAGTMGSGIAQVAAAYGHSVVLVDSDARVVERAVASIEKNLARQVEKGKLGADQKDAILSRLRPATSVSELSASGIVVEAIVENLDVKRALFGALESTISPGCVIASNTSSLSIASLGGSIKRPERFLGVHFFNPAHIMPLVEIVPGIATSGDVTTAVRALVEAWGKSTVLAKDTPGFIVNRVARPFYGEALRILEEGIADVATIDWAMKDLGGFKMGPFELMDFIGNDVNLQVTQTVFAEMFYDPRYKPSLTQKRLVEGGRLGRKSGRGYYDYSEGAQNPSPRRDEEIGKCIFLRILSMLINEAADAVYLGVASAEDIERAMTLGVNYPRGLLEWADEIGPAQVLSTLESLQDEYREDRYRPSPLLRRTAHAGKRFLEQR